MKTKKKKKTLYFLEFLGRIKKLYKLLDFFFYVLYAIYKPGRSFSFVGKRKKRSIERFLLFYCLLSFVFSKLLSSIAVVAQCL